MITLVFSKLHPNIANGRDVDDAVNLLVSGANVSSNANQNVNLTTAV